MALTEKGLKVIEALQSQGIDSIDKAISAKDIAAATFMLPNGVPGVLTSLNKKGLVDKTEESPRNYFLSDAGKSFDPTKNEDADV